MARNSRVSSSEVARRAGVSRTTVSFVLNRTPGKNIPEETRKLVYDAARELDYVPDEDARRVAKKVHSRVGFIASHSQSTATDAYILRLLEGMAQVLNRHRCALTLLTIRQRQVDYLDIMQECALDGVIVTNTHEDDRGIRPLAESGVPLVVIGSVGGLDAFQIDIDNAAAAEEAVSYMTSLGLERIAMIVHAPLSYYAAGARLGGYRRALEAAGIDFDERLVRIADFSELTGYAAMSELLDSGLGIEGVFAGNDAVAYGAIQAIYDRKLRIPDDISVVGFDDDFPSRFMHPPLTTITLPASSLGARAAATLVELIRGKEPEERSITMPTSFTVRESCRKP
ncbi:MAG: LacI family DNA-binding transcriptional regulator [Rectinemataceae bacterium]